MRGSLNRTKVYEFGERFSEILVNLHNEIAASDYEIEHWMEQFKKRFNELLERVESLEKQIKSP